jgi:hypothetical protein
MNVTPPMTRLLLPPVSVIYNKNDKLFSFLSAHLSPEECRFLHIPENFHPLSSALEWLGNFRFVTSIRNGASYLLRGSIEVK